MFTKRWAFVYKQYPLVTFNVSDNLDKHDCAFYIHIEPYNFDKS